VNYETTPEIEIAVAAWFGTRVNIIVPNVSWGMFGYELDMCCLSAAMYASEVEIKISRADLKRDQKKQHRHDWNNNLIKYLWFAIPERMLKDIEFVPQNAGILYVTATGKVYRNRPAIANAHARKWTTDQALKLARLGTLRIWPLKRANLFGRKG
jgi:hypothetical protein